MQTQKHGSCCEKCHCKVDRCAVTADGHCGCIEVERGAVQVVYLQSLALTLPTMFGGRQFVTLDNEGPGTMQVWIDTLPSNSIQLSNGLAGPPVPRSRPELEPVEKGLDPNLSLMPGQSATVAVATVVLVSAADRHAEGCFVVSWCCPEGVQLHLGAKKGCHYDPHDHDKPPEHDDGPGR